MFHVWSRGILKKFQPQNNDSTFVKLPKNDFETAQKIVTSLLLDKIVKKRKLKGTSGVNDNEVNDKRQMSTSDEQRQKDNERKPQSITYKEHSAAKFKSTVRNEWLSIMRALFKSISPFSSPDDNQVIIDKFFSPTEDGQRESLELYWRVLHEFGTCIKKNIFLDIDVITDSRDREELLPSVSGMKAFPVG